MAGNERRLRRRRKQVFGAEVRGRQDGFPDLLLLPAVLLVLILSDDNLAVAVDVGRSLARLDSGKLDPDIVFVVVGIVVAGIVSRALLPERDVAVRRRRVADVASRLPLLPRGVNRARVWNDSTWNKRLSCNTTAKSSRFVKKINAASIKLVYLSTKAFEV